eukprot:TRINITY_DN50429_c0_g1_i1.p1 TRINITY_DN50429_c0_g1~~TRINITY_DN50429_c0_g1_i1.p1  ORF type:complete len:324 (-),score=48.46 TRINITY_DN50429_c0_g1_i1:367-1338(-)
MNDDSYFSVATCAESYPREMHLVREPLKDISNKDLDNTYYMGDSRTKDSVRAKGPPRLLVDNGHKWQSFGTRHPPPGPTTLLDGLQWELRRRRLRRTLLNGSDDIMSVATDFADLDETVSTIRMSLAGRFSVAANVADGSHSGLPEDWSLLLGNSASCVSTRGAPGAASAAPSNGCVDHLGEHDNSGPADVSVSEILSEGEPSGDAATPSPFLQTTPAASCVEVSPSLEPQRRLRRASHIAKGGLLRSNKCDCNACGTCVECQDKYRLRSLALDHLVLARQEEIAARETREHADRLMSALHVLRDDLRADRYTLPGVNPKFCA